MLQFILLLHLLNLLMILWSSWVVGGMDGIKFNEQFNLTNKHKLPLILTPYKCLQNETDEIFKRTSFKEFVETYK